MVGVSKDELPKLEKELKEIVEKLYLDRDFRVQMFRLLLDFAIETIGTTEKKTLQIKNYIYEIEKMVKEINDKITVIEKQLTDNKEMGKNE
jgi:hypothetical protein